MKQIVYLALILLIVCIMVCFELPRPIKGDVNCDRRVTVTDLVILRHHLEKFEPMKCPGNADLNGDFKVDVLDLVKLQRILAGLE